MLATVDEDVVLKFLADLKKAKSERMQIPRPRGAVSEAELRLAKEMVEFGYREFAKKRHPDHGGTQEEMQLLNEAIAWLRNSIKARGAKK